MVHYRRNRIPGGSYFFTVALHNRRSHVLTEQINFLRKAFRQTQSRQPFSIDAIVILPEHLHTIWTLPPGDADYSGRWRALKGGFTRALHRAGIPVPHHASGEYALWQGRFWEHTLRDERDRQHHVDYIHYNPVKHGYVSAVADWPWSSFHRYVQQGLLPRDWAGTGELHDEQMGE